MVATSVAATGVHKPISRSRPEPMPNIDSTVTRVEGSLDNRPTARQLKAIPSTKRSRRGPTPGQPWANVENRRRKSQFSFIALSSLGNCELCGNPKESVVSTLLGVVLGEASTGAGLCFDDAAFQADHGGVGPVMGA